MEWGPTAKDDVEKVALPLMTVPVPNTVAPFLNVTVPVGVPLPGATAATGAVNVTDWSNTEGLCDEITVVELAALFTVSVRTAEVLVL
jgi:hypothetical protein